ncbi:hypothetical protein GOP47_0005261 [Adiantum capillus-veneris]|uniref:Small-subunit processome Utp12 domain-containing protein n=1 Tax=Adiantum capillus-veneris TaxID=13818 RepID=A0A9D4V6F0_ADICA|nr:hypothetical protein GOP47_0005261 [Adiantum capillus-veneris]
MNKVAAGYGDGSVRIWNIIDGSCETTLNGHKKAITALCYNTVGALLASGSKDTDIIIWDAIGEAGLFRLRGHKDQVTDVRFLEKRKRLVSCSKDTFLRVWDLDTKHCIQTVVGHRTEIWSLDVNPSETLLVTGSSDLELRVYSVDDELGAETTSSMAKSDVLKHFGDLKRQSTDRVMTVRFNRSGSLMGCQVAGKMLEIYKIRDELESLKQVKKRNRRRREKDKSKQETPEKESSFKEGEKDLKDGILASDMFHLLQVVRVKQKARSFSFSPAIGRKGQLLATIGISLHNNSLEVYDLTEGSFTSAHMIDLPGHRSDVRSLTLSHDNTLLMSTSHNSVKIWNPITGSCLRTIEAGYGLSGLFVPGNGYAIVGTKAGKLEIFDIGASERVNEVEAHEGAIWSVTPSPAGQGFVSGSADHDVKFWDFELVQDTKNGTKTLNITNVRTLKMSEDVLSVRFSPDAKYIAVALLDSTIKVFFADSLKFFLSLYGHKLPVLCMDISSDAALLASGSADKNIKIWGLDFGDCHRSLFAHADSVMAVQFVRNTHYLFSVGKDCMVKYWDTDKFELLLTLEGHHAEVWCLAISSLGDFLVTGSHDRSIRRWDRTEEPFFIEEEREKRLEALFDAGQDSTTSVNELPNGEIPEEGAVGLAGKQTQETVTAADSIIEALDLAESESERLHLHEANKEKSVFQSNVLMLGLTPSAYVLRALSNVRASDLEQALLALPFTDALKVMTYLKDWMIEGSQVELVCRVAILLLHLHHSQMVATVSCRSILTSLHEVLQRGVKKLKDTIGFNLAAMGQLQELLSSRSDATFKDSRAKVLAIREKLAKKVDKRPDQSHQPSKKRKKRKEAA